jgi:glycosyltransferase involved in cell wall biosynthesis
LPTNKGPGNARNIGVDNADTEYIAFLDSDDVWSKNKLEIQYKFMKKNKIDISGHKSIMYSKRHSQNSNNEISYKKVNKYKFLLKNIFPTRSVMMRKDLPHRFQEDKRRSEDFLLWSQILLSDKKAYYIDKVLAYSFKEGLGEGGLTQDVKEMHKEKSESLKILKRKGYINVFPFLIAYYFEKIKYIKRIIQQLRK